MTVQAKREGPALRLMLRGELDHSAAQGLWHRIEDIISYESPRDCCLDLSKVSFMDSSGIAIILKTYRMVNSAGGRLWIENAAQQPLRVLDASGIDRIIKITALN
ncbi:MAG: STAS domain-containing protein [Oscillospiraceae bacterium]|nr:STAS domain-containing protein [Oscillospiraceae bacterium]